MGDETTRYRTRFSINWSTKITIEVTTNIFHRGGAGAVRPGTSNQVSSPGHPPLMRGRHHLLAVCQKLGPRLRVFPSGQLVGRGEPVHDMPQLTDVPRPQQTRPEKSVECRCGPSQLRRPPLELDLFAGPNATGNQDGDRPVRAVDLAGPAHPRPPAIN